MMKELTAEEIERMAHVAYEAQRALIISGGMAALSCDAPRPWVAARDSDKHLKRMEVVGLWNEVKSSGAVRSEGRGMEELLTGGVVAAFFSAQMAAEKARQVHAFGPGR